jgi:hypothetical protein
LKLFDAADVRKLIYAEIAKRTGFPRSTVRDWRIHEKGTQTGLRQTQWRNDISECSHHLKNKPSQSLSGAKSSFRGHIFQDADFRASTIAAWFEKYRDNEHVTLFNCSGSEISAFIKQHRFTSRAFHSKHGPWVTPEQQQHWTDHIEELLRTAPRDRILNADEPSRLVWPRGFVTWTEVNCDNQHVLIKGNDKDNLPVGATIPATSNRLPLRFLARRKTERIEQSQLDDIAPH